MSIATIVCTTSHPDGIIYSDGFSEFHVSGFRRGDWPIFPCERFQWYREAARVKIGYSEFDKIDITDRAKRVCWKQWLWFVWDVNVEDHGDNSRVYYPCLI